MSVPNIPFYMSAANQEFLGTTTGSISETMGVAGVTIPGLVSQLAGMSAVTNIHTLTVGYAYGESNIGTGLPWTAYGYSNGQHDYDDYKPTVPFGELSPLTFNAGEAVMTIEDFTGKFDEDGAPYETIILTTEPAPVAWELYVMFPGFLPHKFTDSLGVWYEEPSFSFSFFADSIKSFNGQTIDIVIVTQPAPYEVGATGVHTKNLAPKVATNALYFIDPLQFDTTGQIKAFMGIPQRDAVAPLFTQQVTKPPANYYPGTHAYVDGEWVPK